MQAYRRDAGHTKYFYGSPSLGKSKDIRQKSSIFFAFTSSCASVKVPWVPQLRSSVPPALQEVQTQLVAANFEFVNTLNVNCAQLNLWKKCEIEWNCAYLLISQNILHQRQIWSQTGLWLRARESLLLTPEGFVALKHALWSQTSSNWSYTHSTNSSEGSLKIGWFWPGPAKEGGFCFYRQ